MREKTCHVVHGDDFTIEGEESDLDCIQGLMGSWFEIKVRGRLSPEPQDAKEISILGRRVSWEEWGISYEADPKHRRLIMDYFGFDDMSRMLTTNGSKEEEDGEDAVDLTAAEKTSFRAVAARLNFLAVDCPDVQFPAKLI